MLESKDGSSWKYALPAPVLAPSGGWMRSHVYACDFALSGNEARLYFKRAQRLALDEGERAYRRRDGECGLENAVTMHPFNHRDTESQRLFDKFN